MFNGVIPLCSLEPSLSQFPPMGDGHAQHPNPDRQAKITSVDGVPHRVALALFPLSGRLFAILPSHSISDGR